ncbi:MAG: putative capsid protein [Circoviridae sp.]|nr:MAG: putative capsid protein [Circoviridae sp.]
MPSVRANANRKYRPVRKRRRSSSVGVRARYLPRNAKANRALIKSNASMIKKVQRLIPPPLMTDYQYRTQFFGDPSVNADNESTLDINTKRLTDFSDWSPCMRLSEVVNNDKSQTTIYRMNFNMRYTLNNSYWAQITIFIVTLRAQYSNRDPTGQNTLNAGGDFIVNSDRLDPRLNPSTYKIHFKRSINLAKGAFGQPPFTPGQGGEQVTSNSATTLKTGNINMKCRMKVRQPQTNVNWREMDFLQLPYYQPYYMITFITQGGPLGLDPINTPSVDLDMWVSCVNSA